MIIDLTKVDDIELDSVHAWDYPDFCDAFISKASYEGREMTDEELDFLNDQHSDFVQSKAEESLH